MASAPHAWPGSGPIDAHYQGLQLLLVERLRALLSESVPPPLRDAVARALMGEGKLFDARSSAHLPAAAPLALPAGRWALLPLLLALYLAPGIDSERAVGVALAVECSVCAIDLFDDLIDGDQTTTVQALGAPGTTLVAQALSLLAEASLHAISRQAADLPHLRRLSDARLAGEMAVTAGQHQDVLAELLNAQDLTREECIGLARGKGGALMRLACRMGALCAQVDARICDLCSDMGEYLGISHQLDNDCHALYGYLQDGSSPAGVASATKSDLLRGKKTLPIVLAARGGRPFQDPRSFHDRLLLEEFRRVWHEGILTTRGMCLLYREHARDRLLEIEQLTQRACGPALRYLLALGEPETAA